MTRHTLCIVLCIITAALLAACGGTDESQLVVLLTDAPGSFEQVPITVSGVQVRQMATVQQQQGQGQQQGEGAWIRTMTRERTQDLLRLRDGKTAELGEASIPAGSYDRIRMTLSRVSVVEGGQRQELAIPSGEGSGLELQFSFQARAGERHQLVLDLDAEQSITHDGKSYQFQPALSVKRFASSGGGQ
jgi:hypothetical protein